MKNNAIYYISEFWLFEEGFDCLKVRYGKECATEKETGEEI